MTDTTATKLVRTAAIFLMLAVVSWWALQCQQPALPETFHQVELSVGGLH